MTKRFTPRKVLRRAAELGVHADCIAADFSGSCDRCIDILDVAMREFYGHASSAEEAILMILEDVRRDNE